MRGAVVFVTVDDGAASSKSAVGDLASIGETLLAEAARQALPRARALRVF